MGGHRTWCRFLLVSALFASVAAQHAVEDEEEESTDTSTADAGEEAQSQRTTQSVFVVEHGSLSGDSPDWQPRGTLVLSHTAGGSYVEARLSDAKGFIDARPQLRNLMEQAAHANRHYAVRIYSPDSPNRVLQASAPAKLLVKSFEDYHDILELTMNPDGLPVALNYRVRPSLGLALFEHTAVHVAKPFFSDGPKVPPKVEAGPGGAAAGQDGGQQSFLRKYWWVILIVLLVVSSAADPEGGKGGGGGGGKGGGSKA